MLNLHTFPLVPYPGLAPELAVRSGMGYWHPYDLVAPADRLLPFVLTRPRAAGNGNWVNCAWIESADTGVRVATLLPTGTTAGTPPPSALVLTKVADDVRGVDYFVYSGAIIPGLNLPCGSALRLIVDAAYQSPRFAAYADLSGYMLAEWHHRGPLAGVPYGSGLRQRFYVEAGALSFAAPTKKKEVTLLAATSEERTDFLSLRRVATFATEPVPPYLSEALSGLEAHDTLTLDGEAWKAKDVTPKTVGDFGGRFSLSVTLEQEQPVIRRAAPEPALAAHVFNPTTDAARPYHCGDTSDTDPDFQPTGGGTCETDDDGNTGYFIAETRDQNPNSPTFGTTSSRGMENQARCPLPPLYRSAEVAGMTTRNNCPSGQVGSSVYYAVPAGAYQRRSGQPAADVQALVDAQAQAYYDAQRQAYANANGSCATTGGGGTVTYQPVYDVMGCFACQMVNTADATDVRDATGAEIDMYRVNNVFYNGAIRECPACNQ